MDSENLSNKKKNGRDGKKNQGCPIVDNSEQDAILNSTGKTVLLSQLKNEMQKAHEELNGLLNDL